MALLDRPLKLVASDETDPVFNLVLEEMLFRSRGDEHVVLTYVNGPSVVIGRNQNPWTECNLDWLATKHVPVLRRLSGGGTVYHDLGNLNYCFITDREHHNQTTCLEIVVDLLISMGIDAHMCDRFSVWVGDKKIAGSAFMMRGRTTMTHGCLLVNSDLPFLRRALRCPQQGIESGAVASVPSPVTRLADLCPSLALDTVRNALHQQIVELSPGSVWQHTSSADWPTPQFEQTTRLRTSWDWLFGKTPPFTQRVPLGDNSVVEMKVSKGRIQHASMLENGLKTDLTLPSNTRYCRASLQGFQGTGSTLPR